MVYVHLADGFEEVEALTVVDLLRRADIDVQTVSIMGRTSVEGAHSICVEADMLFEDANYDSCDMIVLPGGMPGAQYLKDHEGLYGVIESFAARDKLLAAICAAPMALGAHASLGGKRAVIYPGFESELGDMIADEGPLVEDGNVITAKGPAFATKFALAIVSRLAGAEAAGQVAAGLLYKED